MSDIEFTDAAGAAWTATISDGYQDPQTRGKTARLTLTDAGGAVVWRDWIRAKPIDPAFIAGVLRDEAGVEIPEVVAGRIVTMIRDA